MADEIKNAAGSGESGNEGGEGDEGNKPSYVTSELMDKAIKTHLKQVEKKMSTELNGIKELLQGLTKTSENTENNTVENTNNTTNENTNKATKADKPDPEMLRMKKAVEDLQKALETERQAKETETQKAKSERLKSDVLRTLSELKVEKADQVYELVKSKIINEDGSVKIRVFDPSINLEDDKDLKSGLTDWLNTDGQHFLPARNTGGSGANAGSGAKQGKTYTEAEVKQMSASELASKKLTDLLPAEALAEFKDYFQVT